MIFDSHTHSRFSADSKAEPRDMMEAALKKGLAGLCVTDHYDCDEIPAFCTLENLRGAKAALEPRGRNMPAGWRCCGAWSWRRACCAPMRPGNRWR